MTQRPTGHGPNSKQRLFDLQTSNIPIINVQQELTYYHSLRQDETFRARFANVREPIDIGHIVWRGLPKDLLTYCVQRGILAIEASVDAAVEYQAQVEGRFDDEFRRARSTVWNSGGSATVYYNRLPGLLSDRYKLCNNNRELRDRTKQLYSELRNPLFHGSQLYHARPESVLQAFDFLRELLTWIDTWCSWHRFPV
jgi:hypothetical protein